MCQVMHMYYWHQSQAYVLGVIHKQRRLKREGWEGKEGGTKKSDSSSKLQVISGPREVFEKS